MMAPLRWILQSLNQFKEDLIEFGESDDSVPLVPIGNECISAITKSNMKAFLKSIGLQTPGVQVFIYKY